MIPRFGPLARTIRQAVGVSQGALARSAVLSPSTVRGWEASRSEPSMAEFARWSRALDLPDSDVSAIRATLHAPRAWADRPGIGLGPYLRERRLAAGVTLSHSAANLKLPLATLGHYEANRVEVPAATLRAIVDQFDLPPVEREALSQGTGTFLEWCDSLVQDPDVAQEQANRAAYAHTAIELADRGPAFVRMRTGLLRVRIRGDGWATAEQFSTAHHALWLAIGERRAEAASALASLVAGQDAVAAVVRRYLGRARADELQQLADATGEANTAAWLRAEAALDLCDRRYSAEARKLIERTIADSASCETWSERWMRLRDGTRVALRLRDWDAAQRWLGDMASIEPTDLPADDWFRQQRQTLTHRLEAKEATARAAESR